MYSPILPKSLWDFPFDMALAVLVFAHKQSAIIKVENHKTQKQVTIIKSLGTSFPLSYWAIYLHFIAND